MPENERTACISFLPCKKKKLFLSLAAILAIFCTGIRSQKAGGYSITVESPVFVQLGLAVRIPCQFTYNEKHLPWSGSHDIFAYWINLRRYFSICSPPSERNCWPVATNNQYQTVEPLAKDRFHLLGDPNQGNCSLIIMDAQVEDEGQYGLRIEGGVKFSFINRKVFVHVKEPLREIMITVYIDGSEWQRKDPFNPVIVKEGSTVTLTCTADGKPAPTISWMKDDQKIVDFTHDPYIHHLRKVGPEHSGKYQCLANNEYGSLKKMVEVIVQYQPRILFFKATQTLRRGSVLTQGYSNASELTAEAGDSLEMWCEADGNLPATTSWVKRDGPLQKPQDNPLTLTNLTVEDEGVYECKATNMLGVVQGTFRLSVMYAPKLSRSPPKNTTCYYHENGFLCTCTLHAKPLPQIEWEVDGERISEESGRENLTVQKNEVTSTLNWSGSLDRAHNIICTGSNSYGIQSIQFLLNASIGRSNKAVFIAGLCGVFLGAGIFMLCLFLIKVFKQKKALLEASQVEVISSGSEPQKKPKSSSHIYSNILPMGSRLPPADKPKPAGERKPKLPQGSTNPVPRRPEPPELQYAAIDFKQKRKAVPDLNSDEVEYTSIQKGEVSEMRKWLVPLFVAFFRGSISTQEVSEDETWWEGVALRNGYGLKAPNFVLVEEGLCATIPCIFTYNRNHARWNTKLKGFWRKGTDNDHYTEVPNSVQLIGDPTTGNCSLLIMKPTSSDAGTYFFRMEKEPKALYSFQKFANPQLNVTKRQSPKIQMPDKMRAGHSANITCETFASCSLLPPNVTWNGFPHPIDPHSQVNETQVYSSMVNFTPTVEDHKRNITCRVNYINEFNPVSRETTVQLNVLFKPIIEIQVDHFCSNQSQENVTTISPLSVQSGDCIRLCCKVKGNPLPNVTWVKETKDLVSSTSLEFSNIKPEDDGKYTCKAVNEIDFEEAHFQLSVNDPNKILVFALIGTSITLGVIVLIIGIILVSKRYRRKSKRATDSEKRITSMNDKKRNTLDLTVQEVNGVPSKPRSTHESVDGDPGDPEEIHYASIIFNARNPKTDVTAEDTQTDYAEIRPCNSLRKEV
ncbi:sialic acid-binding Ig-like lectin 10 [Erythrolamprus reginae]|uniref:sialic acid-binding Ig-like lectin 10 n=1 Tax=Erythrolamprus reginae TaxID=121349 RepID=UPI00396CA081